MIFYHLDLIVDNGLFRHGWDGSPNSIYKFSIYRVQKFIYNPISNLWLNKSFSFKVLKNFVIDSEIKSIFKLNKSHFDSS